MPPDPRRGRASSSTPLSRSATTTPPRSPSPTRSPFPPMSPPMPMSPSLSSVSVSTRVETPNPPATPKRRHKRNGTGSRSLLSAGALPSPAASLLAPQGATTSASSDVTVSILDASSATASASVSAAASTSTSAAGSPGTSTPHSPTHGHGHSLASLGALGLALPLPSPRPPSPTIGVSRTPSRKGKERAGTSDDAEAVGEVSTFSNDARRGLRELVARAAEADEQYHRRRTRSTSGRSHARVESRASAVDIHHLAAVPEREYSPRRYYVLTNAGKPVFSITSELMGIAQALISIFAEDDDKPRSIIRGRTQIVFVVKQELYFFAVSDWGEPEHVLRMHLEYINLQILSVVTGTQLARAFQRRSNFDLSRLLEEPFLVQLVKRCQDDLSIFTTALQPLQMAPALRDTAAAALMPPAKFKDLLYVLLIAGGRMVTLLRPRRHAVHPSDMHLLLNMLATSATLRELETWLPLCLPKFNPAGFVHAYISFVREQVGLVFISADRNAFEALSAWRVSLVEQLKRDGALDRIEASVRAHGYTVAAVGSPGLLHFVYRSRGLIQLTAPEWDEPYMPASPARARLLTLYARVQDALHGRSGQAAPRKLVYMATAHEAVLGWLTKPFELYITVSPRLPMSAVVSTANRVAKWVNAEDARFFLRDAPVF